MNPLSKLRNVSHSYIKFIWQGHCAGVPLEGEAQILAQVLARYPQWAHYWEMADDLGDAEVLLPDGADPFAVVAFEALVEGMLSEGGTDWPRRHFEH